MTILLSQAAVLIPRIAHALTAGGDVAATTDYIFRGISESDGHGALQLDLHAMTLDGTFAGVFASTLSKIHRYGADYELEAYLGHRFQLSQSWSATITGVDYAYLGGNLPFSNDYQELGASVSWLDRWTLSVAAAPNTVRYAGLYRLGRYMAYVTDGSAQLPIEGPFFFTAGIGYYSLRGPEADDYVYGNAGLAFQRGPWRADVGYYAVERRAQYLFPYGEARSRVAATLSWHF